MRKDNIISFVRLERARKVRILKSGSSKSDLSKSDRSKSAVAGLSGSRNQKADDRDKIVSLRPRKMNFPFPREVKNLDVPNGPFYL